MEKTLKYVYVTILAIIALLALVIIVSSSNFFGRQAYVVKTGSMSPHIPAGSVVFDTKEANYRKGDVITYIAPNATGSTNSSNLVTHRIIQVSKVGQVTYYKVKGDANTKADPTLVPKDDVVGKVGLSFSRIGHLVAFIKTTPGVVVFIVIPGTIIVYEESKKIKNEIVKIRKEAKVIEKDIEKDIDQEKRRITSLLKRFKNIFQRTT